MQANHPLLVRRLSLILVSALAAACGGGGGDAGQLQASTAQSCMLCHNGSLTNNYAGPGIENPHPYGAASNMLCTTCHGGNGQGADKDTSHVPPPPQIGDQQNLTNNATAYFNRLTLAGIDRYADYTVNGVTYSALDYLQFINPGDLRVVSQSRACGQCHDGHAEGMWMSPLATEMGILGGAMYAAGVDNRVPDNVGLHGDTAADTGFRAVTDPNFNVGTASAGAVGELVQFPLFSVRNQTGGDNIFQNQAYTAALLNDDRNPDNSLVTGSHLANLVHEQIAFTCGDCHLGSAGANNRYGDFRSSGCTACHMRYSLDGRSGSGDPNVNALEPIDPDDIDAPERSHINRHLVRSIAKTLPGGEQVQGIDDYACAGCHQGSNRTVMQYWGIRLDQNEDVHRGRQYPANPDSFVDTGDDPRLFDPVVDNNTFNGRRDRQYLLFEDYDGDGRDDTPADVHYDAGLGCIDCHGSYDLHGPPALGQNGEIASRMEQAVAIRCESCHGSADAYAATAAGTNYSDAPATLAMDSKGNPLKHVQREADGHYYLYSRLTGQRHFVKQTRDVVVDSGKLHPFTGQPVYSELGSYAMGRDDGSAATGIGPQQGDGSVHTGFSHADNVSCAACHASWANSCIGCHLKGEYDNGNNFSNITGQRIVYKQANADFVYQTPVPFQLGIGPDNKIVTISPNTEMFYQYQDINGAWTNVLAFSNRNGGGNNATPPELPALSHNVLMPHSIRGKVSQQNEGPRYCVACHLTTEGMTNFGAEYAQLRTAMTSGNFQGLDFDFFNDVLKPHIGLNPGNSLNSPLWVHMVAGLGTGLFLFDQDGCPENPLDNDPNRIGCNGAAPSTHFNLADAAFNLDRIVAEDGSSNASNNHAMLVPGQGPNLRDGPSSDPDYSGPLGMTLIQRLADPNAGIVLDAWIDADGQPGGGLSVILQQNP